AGAVAQRPDGREHHDDGEVEAAVKQADALGARPPWNGQPVDQSEQCRKKPCDDAGGDVPVGDGRKRGFPAPEIRDVENDCGDEQSEREHDDHRMNRMAEQLGSAFHDSSSSAGSGPARAYIETDRLPPEDYANPAPFPAWLRSAIR